MRAASAWHEFRVRAGLAAEAAERRELVGPPLPLPPWATVQRWPIRHNEVRDTPASGIAITFCACTLRLLSSLCGFLALAIAGRHCQPQARKVCVRLEVRILSSSRRKKFTLLPLHSLGASHLGGGGGGGGGNGARRRALALSSKGALARVRRNDVTL